MHQCPACLFSDACPLWQFVARLFFVCSLIPHLLLTFSFRFSFLLIITILLSIINTSVMYQLCIDCTIVQISFIIYLLSVAIYVILTYIYFTWVLLLKQHNFLATKSAVQITSHLNPDVQRQSAVAPRIIRSIPVPIVAEEFESYKSKYY